MTDAKEPQGPVLTDTGLERLNKKIQEWANGQNPKKKGSHPEIAKYLDKEKKEFKLDRQTIDKILATPPKPTSEPSLRKIFKAFDLKLTDEDYTYPDTSSSSDTDTSEQSALELPQGQVGLNSPLYIERPPIEQRCYDTIMRPGALIRIKAPKQMGKTSLMARIVDRAKQQGCQIATVDFQMIDKTVLTNLDQFLKWFCAYVVRQLKPGNKIEDYWDPIFGSKVNCHDYFEDHILANTDKPVVLALDEVDRIFKYEDIADDFLGLLRAWHEEAKRNETWKPLRLILAHSTEVYIPININQSPFNVGLPVELSEFNLEQVQELAQRHQLELSEEEITRLMDMVGGHPYLVRVALYHLADTNIDVDMNTLLRDAPTEAGVYSDHLRRHLSKLEAKPDLAAAMKQVVESDSISLKPTVAYKLNSMGLTKQQEGDKVEVRYQLYRKYFSTHLK